MICEYNCIVVRMNLMTNMIRHIFLQNESRAVFAHKIFMLNQNRSCRSFKISFRFALNYIKFNVHETTVTR